VLLIVDVQTRAISVHAWNPEIRAGQYGVLVHASGPGAGDLPTLRSIVLSVANERLNRSRASARP
jgi:hypothetical protein